jgi:glycolate oxidase FAD binding subunit
VKDRRLAEVADVFRDRLGPDAVDVSETRWRYACNGVVPFCVVRPSSVEAVQAAVRVAGETGCALVASGNGTHLNVGFPPRRYEAAVTTVRLDRVLAHEAGDMTVTVEAGATLDALNARLLPAGQWLPLDPAPADRITIGGLIAADRCGPMRLAYGKVRDHLLGLTVVTADGGLLRGGGRVVKNVAGYDLPKLFAGSFGTLGVIVEATFKLRPRPAAECLFVWSVRGVVEAVACGGRVLESAVTPVSLAALNDAAAEMSGVGATAALVIGLAGSDAEVEAQGRQLRALSADIRPVAADEDVALARALRAFPQPLSEDALVARVSTVPARLGSLLRRFEDEARLRKLTLEIAAHAGSGVAWCQLAGPLDRQHFALCAEWMRVHGREHGAWVLFEALPAELYGRIDPWGFSEPALPLMAGVKRTLDPHGLFSPGRFVGGI